MNENIVQAVTVCHNTPNLIIDSVCSLKKFHPTLPIIIINGSDKTAAGNDCTRSCYALRSYFNNVEVFDAGYNIGHGQGLHEGILKCVREHVLLFDTDIFVRDSALDVFPLVKYYASGQLVYVNSTGHNCEPSEGIKYIHPHFAMINRPQYLKFPKFRNAGAPLLAAMKAINKLNPDQLIDVDVKKAVVHLERGTRKIIPLTAKYHSAPSRIQREAERRSVIAPPID